MSRAALAVRVLVGVTALALLAGGAARRTAASEAFADEAVPLLREIGFSTEEIQKIDQGEVVVNSLDPEAPEVALVVAATIHISPAFYLERFRDITSFKRTSEVLQIGRVSATPSVRDFAPLTLEIDDVKDLRRCRVDDCDVKLDRAGIDRLANPDADLTSASAGMREFLASYSSRYLQRGNQALIEYHGDDQPRRLADDLQKILNRSGYLQRRWPDLFRAVGGFTGSFAGGLDGFLYWSKEKVGPRAVVTVTHVIISPVRGGTAAIATKQVYASHYSDGSLGITMLIERPSAGRPRTLVVYTNRTRLDVFGGIFGGLKRPIVRSRARDGAEKMMGRLREKLEHAYGSTRR
jgi:hypothetical protein